MAELVDEHHDGQDEQERQQNGQEAPDPAQSLIRQIPSPASLQLTIAERHTAPHCRSWRGRQPACPQQVQRQLARRRVRGQHRGQIRRPPPAGRALPPSPASPPQVGRFEGTRCRRVKKASTATSLAALSTAGAMPPCCMAWRARPRAVKRRSSGRSKLKLPELHQVEALGRCVHAAGPGQAERRSGVRMSGLASCASIEPSREADQRMHDRLRMHHHLELARLDREQVIGLDQLQPLVHQGRRVDGDLAPHGPVGVHERLLRRGVRQLAPGSRCGTARRRPSARCARWMRDRRRRSPGTPPSAPSRPAPARCRPRAPPP